MRHVKCLILGAGPAGLSFAVQRKKKGEDAFIVLEKEKTAGGLCRSETVDASPFDIGGGHFLDVRRPLVNELLFSFMPRTEWQLFERDSRIALQDAMIHHPMEANIWELDLEKQVSYLKSISQAGCNTGQPAPESFVDWITWKLGSKIAEDYMLPYNQKMFADELNELGTYWLEKLPNVSFEETLLSCLTHKAYGTQPGHAQFYYPKEYGYGEVWRRMADSLHEHIEYKRTVKSLDFENTVVTMSDGERIMADVIVTTIPWNSIEHFEGIPEKMVANIRKLKSSAIETRYVPENLDTKAQWIYYPDTSLPYHRILVRHNFSFGSRGYWYETRKERVPMFGEEGSFCYLNEYAYPLNTLEKPAIMQQLLSFAKEHQVYGLGRWGEHSHFNSDVTVERAMKLADSMPVNI